MSGSLVVIWLICDADLRTKRADWGSCEIRCDEVEEQFNIWNDFGQIQPAYPEPQPLNCWGCGTPLEKPGGGYTLAVCPNCNPILLMELRREARAICPSCKGLGEVYDFSQRIDGLFKRDPCLECYGSGKRQEKPPSDELLAFIYGPSPLLTLDFPRCCEKGHPWGPCDDCMRLNSAYWLTDYEDSDFDRQGNLIENEVRRNDPTLQCD